MKHIHFSPFFYILANGIAILTVFTVDTLNAQSTAPYRLNAPERARPQILRLIWNNYFDSIQPDSSLKTTELASHLDPWSYYETNEDRLADIQYDLDHEWGWGLDAKAFGGEIVVTSLVPEGPCYQAGMRAGDQIVAINSIKLGDNFALFDSLMLPRSNGTFFRLKRPSTGDIWTVLVSKILHRAGDIPYATLLPDKKHGYIEIDRFSEGIAAELERKVDSLLEAGMTGLVIDLRDNPGGKVTEALTAVNLFTNGNAKRLMSTWSTVYENNHQYWASHAAKYSSLPVSILVNNRTASAAELFSGIMQDCDRALIVGQPTTGKALITSTYDLCNGDYLHLAISKIYLPSGRTIQRMYLKDSLLGGRERCFANADNRKHELDRAIAPQDCQQYYSIGGRQLYSGEGVVPDVITSENFGKDHPQWLLDSIENAVIPYMRMNGAKTAEMGPEAFAKHFKVPATLTQAAISRIRSGDESYRHETTAKFAGEVPYIIKWWLAYELWNTKGWINVRLATEPAMKRAIALMGDLRLPATASAR